jgi:hypothetical protein
LLVGLRWLLLADGQTGSRACSSVIVDRHLVGLVTVSEGETLGALYAQQRCSPACGTPRTSGLALGHSGGF